ncbi:hypothetical protein VTK56DRAFT_5470 [Thermocarpiscus australiensis]
MKLRHNGLLAALGAIPTAMSRMQFINPPEFGGPVMASQNPIRYLGEPVDIKWTPNEPGKKLSVVLYQLDADKAREFRGSFHWTEGPFEFITHDQVDATEFTWIVGTTKDLNISPMFSIAVWAEGANYTDSATDIFNITKAEATTTTTRTSSTSTSATLAPTSSTAANDAAAPSPPPATGNPPAPVPVASSDCLPAGGAAGIGVGAAVAAMAAAAAGWFLWKRKKWQSPGGEAAATSDGSGPRVGEWTYYRPAAPQEAMSKPVVMEMPAGDKRGELP